MITRRVWPWRASYLGKLWFAALFALVGQCFALQNIEKLSWHVFSMCSLHFFFYVCVCVCVWVFVRWVIPARFLSAWQDQHCDDFGVYGGFVVLKSRCRAWKPWPWVTWSESIWELDDAAMPLCMYIYIYYHWSYSRCQEVTPCHCQLPTIIKPG